MVKFSFIVFNIYVLWRYIYYKGIIGIIRDYWKDKEFKFIFSFIWNLNSFLNIIKCFCKL